MIFQITVGRRILNILEEKKITVTDFVKAIDVPEENITEWKYGNYNPTLAQIVRISDYLDVTTDYIIKGDRFEEILYICPRCSKRKKKKEPFNWEIPKEDE